MTVNYFERRACLDGISDSYANIRREGNAPGKPSLRSRLSLLKAASKVKLLGQRKDIEAIGMRINYAYRQGYTYHQSQVRCDLALLEWVLKSDYWDYQLPEGWESYLPEGNNQESRKTEAG
jgi:hypothetical protein